MNEDTKAIEGYIQALKGSIEPKLFDSEKPTFLIRPAVTHGDIEIFLNGRIFYTNLVHMKKVLEAKALEDYVIGFLPRLRGKRYVFDVKNQQYTLENVQKEINCALNDVFEKVGSKEEVALFYKLFEMNVLKLFNLKKVPEKYNTAQLMILNKNLAAELCRIYHSRREHGRR